MMRCKDSLCVPAFVLVVALGSGLWFLGAGCQTGTGAAGGGQAGPACATDGETCDAQTACCTGFVCGAGGVCEATPECAGQGEPCDAQTACCDEFECVDGTCEPEPGGGDFATERGYVGTDTCLTCHSVDIGEMEAKNDFLNTGHPYKLNQVTGGTAPQYPVTTLPGPPDGVEWADVSNVIGGYRWKYRVIDQDGFVVLGPTAQYNFPTEGFSAYSNDDKHTSPDDTLGPWEENIGRKPYDCGKCHTTGYDAEAANHGGLDGMVGDWAFGGIECEECHGPGADHAAGPSSENITGHPDTDTSCGKCHTRKAEGIESKGGFIRHHEQWDEYSRTAHAQLEVFGNGCATCHDVHKPLWDADRLAALQAAAQEADYQVIDALASPPGIIAQCTDCHGDVTVEHEGSTRCISCHMAFAGKSAVALADNMGDVRSHAWQINADPEAMMFADEAGNPVARDSDQVAFAALDVDGEPFITLDFACLRCHTDRDLTWAAENSDSIHGSE